MNYGHRCSAVALIVFATSTTAIAATGSWSGNGPYGGVVKQVASWPVSPSTAWAIGSGGVFRSTSGGASWSRIETGLPDGAFPSAIAVSSTATPVVYLSAGNRLYRSGDGGSLWVPTSLPCSAAYLIDVAMRPGFPDRVVVTTDSGACVSSNGGASWLSGFAPGSSFNARRVAYATDGTLYVTGVDSVGSKLFKSTDGGVSWSALALPGTIANPTTLAIADSDSARLYVRASSALATSANAGVSWTSVSLPADCGNVSLGAADYSLAVSATSATTLLVGCREGYAKTTNASVAAPVWTRVSTPTGLTPNGSDGASVNAFALHPNYPAVGTMLVGTLDAGLFSTASDGAAWSIINQGFASLNIRALAAHPRDTGASVVLAGQGDAAGPSRPLWKSPDGTATWAASISGLGARQLRALAIDPTTTDSNPLTAEAFTVYGVGRADPYTTPGDGGIYKSTNAGTSWTTIDNGIPFDTAAPPRRNMGTVRAVALDPRSCAAPPPSGPCPAGSGPLQTVYVGGSGRPNLSAGTFVAARIYKSTNGGSSWTAAESGLPMPQEIPPAGSFNYAYTGGVVQIVIDPANPLTLYASTYLSWSGSVGEPTIANGIFKSTNGGATWVHASNGLPRVRGAGSSHRDVLALAIDPANPLRLYAGASNLFPVGGGPITGDVYRSVDGGANWTLASTGIAGQDVRALVVDPADATGNTVYAGTGGGSANPGGVYRTTDGGVTWNSFSDGMQATSATALSLPPRPVGAAPRVLAGTRSGVWDYTFVPDEDDDGAPSAIENGVQAGDGNNDGTPDASQSHVANLLAPASVAFGETTTSPAGGSVAITTSIVGGTCTQLNDSSILQSSLYPPDPLGDGSSHAPWGLIRVSLPACPSLKLRVKFHGATFDNQWTWRNYGPTIPGNDATFAWYTFAGAKRIDATTWELDIAANRQGNYRNDANNILFIGGPGRLPDLIFGNGFE